MTSHTSLGAVALLAVAVISAVPAVAQAPVAPVSGTPVLDAAWDGKIHPDSGLPAGWSGMQVRPRRRTVCFEVSCARYAFKLVSTEVREGTKAARFEVRDGDNPFGDAERAETQTLAEARQGAERWYVWSTRMTKAFRVKGANSNNYLSITRWSNAKGGAAPVGFYVANGQLVLQVNRQKSTRRFDRAARPWGVPVNSLRNRWVDFAMHVKWSSREDGFIELYVDGVPQTMNWPLGPQGNSQEALGGLNGPRYTGRTMVPRAGKIFLKQGIVRATKLRGTSVIFHDAMRSYDAARPAPVAPLPPSPDLPTPLPATPPAVP